jgi:hypothetical protein
MPMPLLGLFVQLLFEHGRIPVLLFMPPAARAGRERGGGGGFLAHGLAAEATLCRLLRRLKMESQSAVFDVAGGY